MCHPVTVGGLAVKHRRTLRAWGTLPPPMEQDIPPDPRRELLAPDYLVNEKNQPPLFTGYDGFGGSK